MERPWKGGLIEILPKMRLLDCNHEDYEEDYVESGVGTASGSVVDAVGVAGHFIWRRC